MGAWVYIYTHTYLFIMKNLILCPYTYIYIHVCMYVQVHVHVYIYILSFTAPMKVSVSPHRHQKTWPEKVGCSRVRRINTQGRNQPKQDGYDPGHPHKLRVESPPINLKKKTSQDCCCRHVHPS